jgi:hypothetical protein
MINYSEIHKDNKRVFVWIFLKGEQVSEDCPGYKDFLSKIYTKKQLKFENEKNINIKRKEKKCSRSIELNLGKLLFIH